MSSKDYYIINVVFAALLFCLFAASFFTGTSELVTCQVLQKTGVACKSCGLTRDFNAFLHLNFKNPYNALSIFVFGWFVAQFIIRVTLAMLSASTRDRLRLMDLVVTLITGLTIFAQFWI